MPRQDPVQRHADGSQDLQDVVEWEPRSALDRLAHRLYGGLLSAGRAGLVVLAVVILLSQVALGGVGAVADPLVGAYVVLSVVPALILAAYVRYADVTTTEPLDIIVGTFLLGLLFAGFASVLNTVLGGAVFGVLRGLQTAEALALAAVFVLVVAPVEEGVKLLAVRLFAYRKPQFDAVIDGAVYGAAAGLGFATIENALYITQVLNSTGGDTLLAGGAITTVRALAGPGHVIYSAFAGYYLGLAKFNRDHAGPIVVKGLVIAGAIHALYNILATSLPDTIAAATGLPSFAAFVLFIVVYDGVLVVALLRKLSRYRAAYRSTRPERAVAESDLTEFDA